MIFFIFKTNICFEAIETIWGNCFDAIEATKKPKRLKLLSHNDLFICPLAYCDSKPYRSKRGCRKHVFTKHGWYYYFEEKPDIAKVLPEFSTRTNNYQLLKRVKTSNMSMFLKTCVVGVNLKKWLQRPSGGGKGKSEADQLLCKFLKYLKYCCADVSISRYIPESVIDCCLASVTMISDFVGYLLTDWPLKSSGVTGYMNALGHLLYFCRSYSHLTKNTQFSIYSIWNIYSRSKTLPIRLERSFECWLSEQYQLLD